MLERLDERHSVPLQDVDLLTRLSQYFDALDEHLRTGNGWFIFNAAGVRGTRVAAYIMGRLSDVSPRFSYYVVPWRDFSLSAYLIEVELQSLAQQPPQEGKAKREFDIATRISRDSMVKMVASDLLVVTGLQPSHLHELQFLDETVERRYNQRLSTILLTPKQPHEMPGAFQEVAPATPFWDRLFGRMYERSLIAV